MILKHLKTLLYCLIYFFKWMCKLASLLYNEENIWGKKKKKGNRYEI